MRASAASDPFTRSSGTCTPTLVSESTTPFAFCHPHSVFACFSPPFFYGPRLSTFRFSILCLFRLAFRVFAFIAFCLVASVFCLVWGGLSLFAFLPFLFSPFASLFPCCLLSSTQSHGMASSVLCPFRLLFSLSPFTVGFLPFSFRLVFCRTQSSAEWFRTRPLRPCVRRAMTWSGRGWP